MLRFLILLAKIGLGVLLLGIMIAGYLIWYFSHDLPDYSQLKEYHPPCVTRVYSADGKLIEEYAREKRIFVPIHAVPKSLVQAFIAAEDKNFYDHPGIDIFSIIRAGFANINHLMNNTRFEGGSTITQQVVKNFLLTSERSIERKVKEAILSYMISQVLSKDQILELYLNQTFLGKGAYGVAAAALAYFNKSAEELSISESAFLASLPKAPSKYSPEKNYNKALIRRNYVIGRMYDDGYITEEEARKAIAESIKLIKHDKVQTLDAHYYAEQVRSEVIGMFGEEYFYTAGLTIITCADSRFQKAAADALRFGIKAYDMKRGYRGPIKNISLDNWQDTLKTIPNPVGLRHYKLGVVLEVQDSMAKVGLQNGKIVTIKLADMSWTKTNLKSVKELLKTGDVIVVENVQNTYTEDTSKIGRKTRGEYAEHAEVHEHKQNPKFDAANEVSKVYKLQQIPDVNGGIMVVEPYTGRVLASEGGYDYDISKFDRTTQAQRQPGSLIKPFVYLTALENGAKPTDIFEDSPVDVYLGPGMPVWRPKNFDRAFAGPMTLRKGLEKSRNTITVRVGQVAGLKKVSETFQRFGINDNPSKVPSIVLGALETTLERMTMAYSAIANRGRKTTPHYIELIKDRKGNVLYRRDYAECSQCKDFRRDTNGAPLPPEIPVSLGQLITDEATSYQITSILMGAIQRGTGQAAKSIPKVIAGKTGTSNDAKDTWFIGFTPRAVIGTYIGYDTPRSLGRKVSGATFALPVFIKFMNDGYKDIPSVDFVVPDSISLVPVNYETGQVFSGKGAIMEAFKNENYHTVKQQDTSGLQQEETGTWQSQPEQFRSEQLGPEKPVEEDDDKEYDPFSKLHNEDKEHDHSDEVY